MRLTRLHPGPAIAVDLSAPDAAERLDLLYRVPQGRWLRLNFVVSVNGSVAGADGTSNSLTSRTDRRILGAIRRAADLVLVGAKSVWAEGYLLPKTAPLAIVTGTGNLGGHRIPTGIEPGRVIVLCPREAADTVRSTLQGVPARVVELSGPRLDPAAMVDVVRGLGYESIVCEGGPSLATQLLNANLVDELCLTTSPQLVPLHTPLVTDLAASTPLTLEHLLVDDDGALYARWRPREHA